MKTLTTIHNKFVLTIFLFPLLFVISCKQADTIEQTQTSSEADISKPAEDVIEKKKSQPSVAMSKTALAENIEVKPIEKQTVLDPNKLPATAAGIKPVGQQPVVAKVVEKAAEKPLLPKPKPALPTFGPDDPRSGIYLSITGKMAGMGNPSQTASDAYRYGRGEHPKALAGVGLPKDKFGLIDWMAIVNKEIIKPRGSLKIGAPELPPFDMNVLITAKGDYVNDVLFPHKAHTYWLKCENCHTGIFIMAKGKNNMTMQGIVQGKWCGRCHGKVAFPLTDCNRCHQTPKVAIEATGVAVKK